MAIVQIDPGNWESANIVQIDSDAADNKQAIFEIDEWAAGRDFARTNEYWLRRIRKRDGQWVFRGICYRITEEVQDSNRETMRAITERAERNPVPGPALNEAS